jgi:hypothetical protein
VALACASSTPEPAPTATHAAAASAPTHAPAARSAPANFVFPPTGPSEIHPGTGSPEGTLYQIVLEYEGRTEIVDDRPKAVQADADIVDEKTSLEVDYRALPVDPPPDPEHRAASLVLEALMRRTRMQPPGNEHLIEVADDRLRVSKDNKVDTDLRGAQPKEDMTPRTVLGKPFAMLETDLSGNPIVATLRGVPTAKKLLGTLPLREPLSYLAIGYPEHAISPGDTWHTKRYVPNPIGKLGLGIDLELRLLDYERNGEAPCAHAVIRAKSDATNVPSETGFTFEEVHYEVSGDVWFDLATGEIAEARLQDISAVAYHRTATARPARLRMRYEGHASLKRLDALPGPERWADGTKRFSAVK